MISNVYNIYMYDFRHLRLLNTQVLPHKILISKDPSRTHHIMDNIIGRVSYVVSSLACAEMRVNHPHTHPANENGLK